MSEQLSPHLVLRSVLTLVVAYTVALGGTLTGVLVVEFQFASLTILTIGAALWLVFFWRTDRVLLPPLHVVPLLWIIAYSVSAAAHPLARVAIGTWWAALYLGLWLVLVDSRRRGVQGRWITDAAGVAMIAVMLLAVAQVQSWYASWLALDSVEVAFVPPRPPGTLGNANALGAVLAMLIPFALVRVGWSPRKPDRVLWGIWFGGAGAVLYLTFSRGAWIAAAAGVGVWGGLQLVVHQNLRPLVWWRARSMRMRRATMIAGLLVLLVAIGLFFLTVRAFDTPRRETSARLGFLRVAWEVFRAEPITGSGPLTYGLALLETRSFPPEQPHAHAHNLIFNTGAELGLLGLLALVITVGAVALRGWRLLRREQDPFARAHRMACAGSLVAITVHSMVDAPLIVPAVMMLMLVIVAIFVTGPDDYAARTDQAGQNVIYRGAVSVLVIGVLGAGWWSAYGYRIYTHGEGLLVGSEYVAGLEKLNDARDLWPDLPLYQAEYGYASGLAVAHGTPGCLDAGIAAYRSALEEEPQHAIWWANLGALYWSGDQAEAALAALQQATNYAPEASDLWLNLGQYYEALGYDENARLAYAQALEADEDWAFIRFWGETPLRERVLTESGIGASPYQRALALWDSGDREGAIDVLEATIDHDPSQPRPYAQLARLHIAGGEVSRAEEYLDAARLLAHTTHDDVWNVVVEAELVRAVGDEVRYAALLDDARSLMWPDDTGHRVMYGLDVAYLQFWRVRVGGVLLPQLTVYGPDPELVDMLQPADIAAP